MFAQKNWLVILLSGTGIQLFKQGEAEIQYLPIPPTIVSNLEVINKDELYTLITGWTKERTYVGTSVIWLLSPDVCFNHTLVSSDQSAIDSETLQFLDTVPFEEVQSRIYNAIEGRTIVAVNKNLLAAFTQGFALHGYNTKAAVPTFFVQAESTLTPELAHSAIKRITDLMRESLVAAPEEQRAPISSSPKANGSSAPKPKSSLPILLGVFVFLLVILGFVLYLNQ